MDPVDLAWRGKLAHGWRVEPPMTPRRFALLLASYLGFLALVDMAAYLGIIPTTLSQFPFYDTIGHFTLIGLAGLLVHRVLDRRTLRPLGVPVPLGPLLVSLGAAVEEALQLLSPRRQASLGDFAADLAGIALFYAVDTLWRARRRPEHEPYLQK